MKSIKSLLESEMQTSNEFTRDNFGLKVGDGFPELVREVVTSEKLSMRLVLQIAIGAMMGKEVIEDIPKERNVPIGPAILKHMEVFQHPLALLYWGIQIGRKLERDEAQALNNMKG